MVAQVDMNGPTGCSHTQSPLIPQPLNPTAPLSQEPCSHCSLRHPPSPLPSLWNSAPSLLLSQPPAPRASCSLTFCSQSPLLPRHLNPVPADPAASCSHKALLPDPLVRGPLLPKPLASTVLAPRPVFKQPTAPTAPFPKPPTLRPCSIGFLLRQTPGSTAFPPIVPAPWTPVTCPLITQKLLPPSPAPTTPCSHNPLLPRPSAPTVCSVCAHGQPPCPNPVAHTRSAG